MINLNILRKEIRMGRRGFLIWAAVTALTVIVYLGFFPYVQDPDMAALLEAYPEAILDSLGMSAVMLTDVNLYHAGMVMSYVLLLASIYALMLAGSLIARDADLGTAEFLYTKPVTRSRIMASKVTAFCVQMVVLWTVISAISVAVGRAVAPQTLDVPAHLTVHLSALLATLAAGGVAFAIAPWLNQTQAATSLGVGLGLGFFVVNALRNITERLAVLKYLTIYHYADLEAAATGNAYIPGMIMLLGIFAAGTALGFVFINRRQFSG